MVQQLKPRPRFLHMYLRALFEKDPHLGSKYHDEQVRMYSEYDPKLLQSFLRKSMDYNLDDALALCRERQMHEEVIFLLGRMGKNAEVTAAQPNCCGAWARVTLYWF